MIKPPFTRIRTFLLGKTASYRLNAYDDAEIAGEIIGYIKTGVMPEGANPIQARAANFIANTPENHKLERLAVQAYTLYHLNGYADLMYSRFIEGLGGLPVPVQRGGYERFESGKIDLFDFWVVPMMKKDDSVVRGYAREQAGIELTLSWGEIMREIVRVQEHNIVSNHRTCQLLNQRARAEHPKVDALCELADTAKHPKIFLVAAARTQVAAGNWDKIVVWYLRRFYPREIVAAN